MDQVQQGLYNNDRGLNIHIVFNVLVCSVTVYFYELCHILMSP